MDCQDVRNLLHDLRAKRLSAASRDDVRAHVAGCAACARADAAERVLDEALERRPRYRAPRALTRRLGLLAAPVPARPPAEAQRWTRFLAPALAAAFAALSIGLLVERAQVRDAGTLARLAGEAVNDHLRQLARAEHLEIRSGGMHQVKPWFEGKLDFAPVVPVREGEELRLQGGPVGYFQDRKAARLEYALRQHVVALLVFRAEGLSRRPDPHPPSRPGSASPPPLQGEGNPVATSVQRAYFCSKRRRSPGWRRRRPSVRSAWPGT